MATQRGKSWQGVVYHINLPTGRVRRNFDSRKEAEAWEIDTKSAAQNGRPIDLGDAAKKREGVPYTLGEMCDYAVKHHWSGVKSGSDASFNAGQVADLIGRNVPVEKIGRRELDRAREGLLKTGISKSTVNRKMAALSKMLALALELEVINRPVKTPKFKENEHRVRRFTVEEERLALAFFDRIGCTDMADLVVVLLDTGLRLSEALGLTTANLVAGKVQVWGEDTKSGRSRTIPLTTRAKAVLEARKPLADGRLWSMSRRAADHYWNRLRATLDLEGDPTFVLHILRHEFCSRLADRGANAAAIQQLAGHSSLTTTQRYIHINADALRAAIEGLEHVPPHNPRTGHVVEPTATL